VGHEEVDLSWEELEQLIREGALTGNATESRFVLSLRWDDRGVEQTAFFQFGGPMAEAEARAAQAFLNRVRVHRPR
jgi:hypothetical protein